VYERTGAVLTGTYRLIADSVTTVTGRTTSFQTTPGFDAVVGPITLPPGHYYIAFLFNDKGSTLVTSKNAHSLNTWVTGDWICCTAASFALPALLGSGTGLNYTMYTNNEPPFWCALGYSGDVIP